MCRSFDYYMPVRCAVVLTTTSTWPYYVHMQSSKPCTMISTLKCSHLLSWAGLHGTPYACLLSSTHLLFAVHVCFLSLLQVGCAWASLPTTTRHVQHHVRLGWHGLTRSLFRDDVVD